MLIKLLFLNLLFSLSLYSNNIISINSNNTQLEDFKISYLIGDIEKLTISDVLSKTFTEGLNKDTLGVDVPDSWVKINLHNTTGKKQNLFLHQSLGFLATDINYYEVDKNNNILNKKIINLLDSTSLFQMNGADAVFEFSLLANEIKTIYVYQRTIVYHFYDFSIFSGKSSIQYLIYEKIDSIFLCVLLLTLSIYNFLIFLSSKYREYLYYSLYLLSGSIWIFYVYGGLAHYFQIYGELPARFNFALILLSLFLSLFIQTIFETKEKYKTEHFFLNSMVFILTINMIYGLIDFNAALAMYSLSFAYVLITFLIISISIYKKGNKIMKIFLFAHIFYISLSIYSLLFYQGLISYTYFSSHGVGIGIAAEALILSYLVSYKFKIISQEKEEERQLKLKAIEEHNNSQVLLFQKSKMADMGEMIANIAHQWRQPLAIIGVSSGILRERKLLNNLSSKDFEEELNYIDLNIKYMSQTIEDFLSYFKKNKVKEEFNLFDTVNKSLLIIGNTIYKEEINVSININEEYKYLGYRQEYMQVLISIISNSIYMLKEKKEKNIEINAKILDNKTILEISDTGGGIPIDIIDKIFEPYFTTKNRLKGTGLGLYISKTIIENSMNGKIGVLNTDKGAKFIITI